MPQAILLVTPEWFTAMLTSAREGGTRRYDVVEKAFPSDVRVIEVRTERLMDWIKVIMESEAFPEIEDSYPITVLDPPVFQVYYDDLASSDEPQA